MRKASAQVEKQPDLLSAVEKSVDNSVAPENESKDPEIEVSVEGEEPPSQKAAKTPDPENNEVSLKKQLEELQRSEQLARTNSEQAMRQRDAALQERAKFETEASKYRLESEQSQLDAILNAMAAAKSEADSAERELEAAITNVDIKEQAKIYRRLAKAETDLGKLEDGKAELEYRIKLARSQEVQRKEQTKNEPAPQAQPQKIDPVEAMQVPERAKEWLREHRDFVEDHRKNVKLQSAHWDALDEGHKEFSTPYFNAVERLLGLSEDLEAEDPPSRPQERTPIVSAPVSREGGSGSSAPRSASQVKLTAAQADAAKMSGVSNKVYAENLLKLQEAKRDGTYGEGR